MPLMLKVRAESISFLVPLVSWWFNSSPPTWQSRSTASAAAAALQIRGATSNIGPARGGLRCRTSLTTPGDITMRSFLSIAIALVLCAGHASAVRGNEPPPKAFIDGVGPDWVDLGEADFVNVNCDPDT